MKKSVKTKVIELYGGPGSGKSTLAAHLFSEFKYRRKSVELVREYAKERVWENLEVSSAVQPILLGEQFHRERVVLSKVEWAVTDAPLLLGALYYLHYNKSDTLFRFIKEHQDYYDKLQNIQRIRVFVKRVKEYQAQGRNESYEEALKVDAIVGDNLKFHFNIDGEEGTVKHFVSELLLRQVDQVYS